MPVQIMYHVKDSDPIRIAERKDAQGNSYFACAVGDVTMFLNREAMVAIRLEITAALMGERMEAENGN